RQARAHDGCERGRDTAAGPRKHARECLALVGLHVHEEEGRRLRPALVVDLRVERILKEGDGDQQHHAGAERDDHPRRMPAGPPQAADAVAPRRPPRASESGSKRGSSVNGTKPASSRMSTGCSVAPRTPPARLATTPTVSVCQRKVANTVRESAPSAFSIAMVRDWRRTNVATDDATPMPPTKRLARPTRPR